jgi:hypothetical protein
MPSKFYVGMHVLDDEGNVYAKSEKWHNSKEGRLLAFDSVLFFLFML